MPDISEVNNGLPITLTYASVLGIIYLILTIYVIAGRAKNNVAFGDGGIPDLTKRIRIHGNFIEYVPLCLILIGLIEVQGGYDSLLYWLGGGLVVARLSHIVALSMDKQPNIFRLTGTGLTSIILATGSVIGLIEVL